MHHYRSEEFQTLSKLDTAIAGARRTADAVASLRWHSHARYGWVARAHRSTSTSGFRPEVSVSNRHRLEDHFGVLLLLLVTSFLLGGLEGDVARTISTVANGVALVVALRTTGLVTSVGRIGALLFVVVFASTADYVTANDNPAGGTSAVVQAVILAVIAAAIIRRLMGHDRVGLQTLMGALCVYFILGLTFGWVYVALEAFNDEPIFVTQTPTPDLIYYSFMVLTTVGFGDITPATGLVQRVSVAEAMTGQIFLATMIARLMSLFSKDASAPVDPGE
jgi:hypothetical protein